MIIIFHKEECKQLLKLINSDSKEIIINIFGESGVGKTIAIQKMLTAANVKFKTVNFTEFETFPFESLFSIMDEIDQPRRSKELFMEKTKEWMFNGNYILLNNFELANEDDIDLIKKLTSFSRPPLSTTQIIFEYNEKKEPIFKGENVCFKRVSDDEIKSYLKEKYSFYDSISEKIVYLANGNLKSLEIILSILKHRTEIYGKTECDQSSLPQTIKSLFEILLNDCGKEIKQIIGVVAAVGPNIYTELMKEVMTRCHELKKMIDDLKHLERLSEKRSIIESNKTDSSKFSPDFRFVSNDALRASSYPEGGVTANIKNEFYTYLRTLYDRKSFYDALETPDQIRLISLMIEMDELKVAPNHIPLVTELMILYNKNGAYHHAIKKATTLIDELTEEYIQGESSYFFVTFFESLFAAGRYDEVLRYKGRFNNPSEIYVLAKAAYRAGDLDESQKIIRSIDSKSIKSNSIQGRVYALESAIEDWKGNYNESTRLFGKALKASEKDDDLKNNLFKNYSMHIDRIPDCISKISSAAEYYNKKGFKRQRAEALHNLGTELILNFQFTEGLKNLTESQDIFNRLCEKEIYHVHNSLAIGHYLKEDEHNAIKFWKLALQRAKGVDYCHLAVLNNLYSIYSKNGMMDDVTVMRNEIVSIISKRFPNFMQGKLERSDIVNQIRYFFINEALFSKRSGRISEAIDFLKKAKKIEPHPMAASIDFLEYNIAVLSSNGDLSKLKKIKMTENKLAKYFIEKDVFLSHIMFWD